MIPRNSGLLAAGLAAVCSIATAAPSGQFYVAPAAYYASPDSKLAADHDFGVQLSVGSYLSNLWRAELISEATKFKRDDGTGSYKQAGISLQGIYSPFDDLSVRPLFIGGAGWLHTRANSQSEDRPLARAGVGLEWQVPETSWSVRGTAIWRHEFNSKLTASSGDLNTTIYSVGLSYRFGSGTTPHAASVAAAPSVAMPAESTSPSAENAMRVEAPQKNIPGVKASDQDGDGIPDAQDKCPDTPTSASVDADGCPIRLK